MSLKDQINGDIKKAMLAKEKDKLRALRAIKSMILLAESEKGAEDGLSEEKEVDLLTKAAKQRKDSATVYREQERADLAETEELELSIIEAYLPAQLSDEEIQAAVKAVITEVGAEGPKDMGKVMGPSMAKLKGQADGKRISDTVKSLLNG